MTYLVVLSVVLIPLIIRTGSDHRNSEIYQAIQIGVLHTPYKCSLWHGVRRARDTAVYAETRPRPCKNPEHSPGRVSCGSLANLGFLYLNQLQINPNSTQSHN